MAPKLQLAELDNVVLVRIFGCLDFQELHRAVPLVCRRFAELAHAPQLLPAEVAWREPFTNGLHRVRSLAEWLVRRSAGTTQRLSLRLTLSGRHGEAANADGLEDLPTTEDDDQAEVLAEVLQAVSFCAASGALRDLDLHMEFLPRFRLSHAAVAALSRLHRLSVCVNATCDPSEPDSSGLFAVVGPLHTMTALRELSLQGEPLVLAPSVRFPASLTKLQLGWSGYGGASAVPEQVFKLSGLRHLSLHNVFDADNPQALPDNYNKFSGLAALETLRLDSCKMPSPESLADMPRLTSLHLARCSSPLEDAAQRTASLATLLGVLCSQLTELSVDEYSTFDAFPEQLAACARLHTFSLMQRSPTAPALPPGAWLGRLRLLALPTDAAAANMQLLQQAATRLERLGMTDISVDQPAQLALLEAAAVLPQLRLLAVVAEEYRRPPAELQQAVAAAQQARPALNVVITPSVAWLTRVVLCGEGEVQRMRSVLRL